MSESAPYPVQGIRLTFLEIPFALQDVRLGTVFSIFANP